MLMKFIESPTSCHLVNDLHLSIWNLNLRTIYPSGLSTLPLGPVLAFFLARFTVAGSMWQRADSCFFRVMQIWSGGRFHASIYPDHVHCHGLGSLRELRFTMSVFATTYKRGNKFHSI